MPDTPDFQRRLRALMGTSSTARTPIRAEVPTPGGDESVAVFRLYDPIDSWGGFWGISAKEFVTALDALPDTVKTIRLHINCPGGDVFEGVAILNALRSHSARVVAVVDGLAASAASFIATGADELVMARNSELMVHDAWGLCVGNAADMRKLADLLDHLSDNIASIYAAKAGGTVEEWRTAMAAETWYSAEEAVAAGLADRVDGATAADEAKNRFDLSIFNFAGRQQAPGPQHPVSDPAGGPSTNPEGGPAVAFSDEQLTNLRQLAGVAEDADETAILAALTTAREAAGPPAPETTPLPEGVVTIDAAQLEELQNAAQLGREAREQQMSDRREQLVRAAVGDGRIPPARRDHWLAQLAADPGAEKVLSELKPGLVPIEPIGNGGAADLDLDAEYASLFGQEAKS